MNFIVPFSLLLLVDNHTHPQRLLLSYYLKRGRENEFYSLWSYLSPQTSPCLPAEVTHFTTLPLSHYLTQRLEMNFTAHALSSPLSTILQLLIHIALIVSLHCSLKEGENQFYSTLPPIKWHTSGFSCFFPFYFLNKTRGQNQFLASASILQPQAFSKGAAHFIPLLLQHCPL